MSEAAARPDPFVVAFGPFVPERFERMRAALLAAEVDLFDRDAWTVSRAGAELLHALRPDGGLGEAIEELVALAHAGFLYWQQGERLLDLSRPALDTLLGDLAPAEERHVVAGRTAYFVRLPVRRVWGQPVPDGPPEPLDGWFAVADAGRLAVVAIFGLLPGRLGFTVAAVAGAPPGPLARQDGSPLFAPVLEGGRAAGLWSLVGQDELLELGWRVHRRMLAAGGPAPGPTEVAT